MSKHTEKQQLEMLTKAFQAAQNGDLDKVRSFMYAARRFIPVRPKWITKVFNTLVIKLQEIEDA